MLFKLPIPFKNLFFLIVLSFLSGSLLQYFLFYNRADLLEYRTDLVIVFILSLLYSMGYILFFSNEKYKDFILFIIFLSFGGSSTYFNTPYMNIFDKFFFIGVLSLIIYILYELKIDYEEKIKSLSDKNINLTFRNFFREVFKNFIE